MIQRRDLAVIGAALTVLLMQFPIVLLELESDPIWFYRVQLYLADLPLAAVAALVLPDFRPALGRRREPALVLALLTLALIAIALAIHPSAIGVQTLLRVAGALALASVVARASGDARYLIVGALAAAALTQLVLALAQLARRTPLGWPELGEFADPLVSVGASVAPRGTMEHPYVLACLALVAAALLMDNAIRAARPAAWAAVAALAAVPVGLTFMRTAALATALGVTFLTRQAILGSRAHRWALGALILGTGIPALLTFDAWFLRAEYTARNEWPHGIGREARGELMQQAFRLMQKDLLFGIGPGLTAQRTRELDQREPGSGVIDEPVHVMPLLIAAEAGVPAGLAFTALVVALGAIAYRTGRLFLYFLFLPFLLLDAFPYMRLQGIVLFACWAGAIHGWGRPVADEDPGRSLA